jgi:hypothetical protein
LGLQLLRGLVVLAVLAIVVDIGGGVAHADGTVTLRGVWYKEKATRVEQPMIDGSFDSGDRATVDAHVLIDAITSASSASGATGDQFSERRWEVGGGYTRRLGETWTVGGNAKLSIEPDYHSYWAGARVERSMFQKNLVVGLAGGVGHDSVMKLMPAPLGGGLFAMDVGTLDLALGSLSVSQIVSRDAIVAFTYDLSVLRGYQQNPYRRAITDDMGFVDERHPDHRTRHAFAVSARRFVPRTETTVIAAYRFYVDSWGMTAHTPELRVVQDAGDGVDVALGYRAHRQFAADFYRATYPSGDVPYVSDDVKLSSFWSHAIEITFGAAGRVFGLGGILGEARGELMFEYVAQDNRFGNAVIAHAAMSVPFEY